MKRIIRLTESDLARIVRRVISEGTETTTMTPVSYTELDYNGNIYRAMTSAGSQLKFNVAPRYKKVTDNKGNTTEDTNVIELTVSVEGVSETSGRLTLDCNSKTAKGTWSSGIVSKDENFCINAGNRGTKCGAEASSTLRSSFIPAAKAWKNQGMVAEMLTKYCKKP
jgi:hypothetical protein